MAHDTEQKVLARSVKAWAEKDLWAPMLQDAYQYAMPGNNLYLKTSQGSQKNLVVYDSTLVSALQRAVNKYISELFPPGEAWANIVPGKLWGAAFSRDEDEKRKVRAMLEDVTQACFGALYSSNFDLSAPEFLADFFVSTGFMLVNPGDGHRLIQCCSVPLFQVALEIGSYGEVCAVFRKFKVKARDVAPTWKTSGFKAPEKWEEYVESKGSEEVGIVEATYYDDDTTKWMYEVFITEGWPGASGKPQRVVEKERQYNPWVVVMYSRTPGESLGRGPIISALPDARVLNRIKELTLQNASLSIAPPLMVIDDGVINFSTIKIKPGAPILVQRNDGALGPTIKPLATGANFDVSELIVKDLQESIRRVMMDDELPPSTGAVRSATEYMSRMRDSQRNTAPRARILDGIRHLFQLVVHYLDEHGILARIMQKHGIQPSKIRVDGMFADIEVTSPLFQTQKLDKMDALGAFSSLAAPFGQEAVLLSIKTENTPKWIWETLGLPTDQVRSEEETKQMQIDAAKVAAQQQAAQNGQQQPAGAPAF